MHDDYVEGVTRGRSSSGLPLIATIAAIVMLAVMMVVRAPHGWALTSCYLDSARATVFACAAVLHIAAVAMLMVAARRQNYPVSRGPRTVVLGLGAGVLILIGIWNAASFAYASGEAEAVGGCLGFITRQDLLMVVLGALPALAFTADAAISGARRATHGSAARIGDT